MTKELFYEKAQEIEMYWEEKMPMLAMEEAGELIQAISKIERKENEITRQGLIDELGDIIISVAALSHHYGIEPSEIDNRITTKMNKKY